MTAGISRDSRHADSILHIQVATLIRWSHISWSVDSPSICYLSVVYLLFFVAWLLFSTNLQSAWEEKLEWPRRDRHLAHSSSLPLGSD